MGIDTICDFVLMALDRGGDPTVYARDKWLDYNNILAAGGKPSVVFDIVMDDGDALLVVHRTGFVEVYGHNRRGRFRYCYNAKDYGEKMYEKLASKEVAHGGGS